MEVSVENTSPLGRRLKVSVPDANLSRKVKSRLNQLSKEVRLKGFRPGNVPPNVMQKRFGESVHAEILNELIQNSFGEALKQHQLQPTGMPTIDEVREDEASDGLEFIATFEVFPEIKLVEFNEFEIEKPTVSITDEDVKQTLEKMRNQMGHWHDVERAAKVGDKVKLNLTYNLKDEKPITHDDFEITLDEKTVLKDLLTALCDKKSGDKFDADTAYPENWPDKRMSGKEVAFSGEVKSVHERHAVKLEELAKNFNLTGDDWAEKLNEKVKLELDKQVEDVRSNLVKERVLEQLDEKNTVEVPSSLLAQEKKAMQQEMESMRKPKLDAEGEAAFEETAHRRVVLGLLINEVVKQKDIKVDGKRVRAEIENVARRYGQPEEIVRAYYRNEKLLHQVERQILLDQAVDVIVSEAKVVDKPMTFDELMKMAEQS
jgi:trigger factor